jgi:hypothetical protein
MKYGLSSWLVLTLTLLMANALAYVVWVSGVWLVDHDAAGLAWFLGVVFLIAAPVLTVLFSYYIAGMREEDPAIGAGVLLSIVLMMFSPSIAPRLLVSNPICQSSFDHVLEDAPRCEFLCFPQAEVFLESKDSYTTSNKGQRTTYTFLGMGEPGSKGPYNVWVKEDGRESDGLCVWRDRSDKAVENFGDYSIPGEQVKDPAASLALYRKWLFIILAVLNGLGWAFGMLAIWLGGRTPKKRKSPKKESSVSQL